MHDEEVAVIPTHVDLHASIVADHVEVSLFLAAGERVEVVYWFDFSDDASLREYREVVWREAYGRDRVVLLNVVCSAEEGVQLCVAGRRLVLLMKWLGVHLTYLCVSLSLAGSSIA
jgi:hypothetical protein